MQVHSSYWNLSCKIAQILEVYTSMGDIGRAPFSVNLGIGRYIEESEHQEWKVMEAHVCLWTSSGH